jgi:spermidine synthase
MDMTDGTTRAGAGEEGRQLAIALMVLCGGAAALTWELLWQIQACLAVGVSARGTAITLAATMGGMTVGAWLAGRVLRRREPAKPLRAYGLLELLIGVSGLLMPLGFRGLEALDGAAYGVSAGLAPAIHLVGILALLGVPTLAMGATMPVLGLVARQGGGALSRLYALNTAGAALGLLVASFLMVPALGIQSAAQWAAVVNIGIFLWAWSLAPRLAVRDGRVATPAAGALSPAVNAGAGNAGAVAAPPSRRLMALMVFTTGFVTFLLEVAWFRSLRAAFQDTTDSFAIMLTPVLVAIAVGARLVPVLRRRRIRPGHLLAVAGVAILLATPLIERFDVLLGLRNGYWSTMASWLVAALVVMGIPMVLLGAVFPWLLDEHREPSHWGNLYALNTFGAIAGAVLGAWFFLPWVGFARTGWLAGSLVVVLAAVANGRLARVVGVAAGVLALAVAVRGASGLGRERIQGGGSRMPYEILAYAEGPDATVSTIAYTNSDRALVIDGFTASSESAPSHYMEWMGRLPMLMHPNPQRALVICFGTGQTANGVRQEGPGALDIVEISPAVIGMAPLFERNAGVLQDPRVRAVVMDGRAWLRRTTERYDVATMEPMPPHFAGVNALYSLEFYQLMTKRLNPGAIVAQWVPFHILPPEYAFHVVATFRAVFPDAVLWVDPPGRTGILLGRHGGGPGQLGDVWPGLDRLPEGRNMSADAIRAAVRLDTDALESYALGGLLITDDNQRLSFGDVRRRQLDYGSAVLDINLRIVENVARETLHGAHDGRTPSQH